MPKVTYNQNKGLFQETGNGLSGFQVNQVSTETVHFAQAASDGYGFHRIVTDIELSAGIADNDVAGSADFYLPAQAIIKFASISAKTLNTSNNGTYALEVHSAAVADDAASAGTEIVGADVAGDASSPDADLDLASDDGTLNDTVTMGSLLHVDRGTAKTYFHICLKESVTTEGTGVVRLVVEYIGGAPVAA